MPPGQGSKYDGPQILVATEVQEGTGTNAGDFDSVAKRAYSLPGTLVNDKKQRDTLSIKSSP